MAVEISVNTTEMMQKKKKLTQFSEKVESTLLKDLEAANKALSATWKGSSGSKFPAAAVTTEKAIISLSKAAINDAGKIAAAVKAAEESDERLKGKAK